MITSIASRDQLVQSLNVALVLASAYMTYKLLSIITYSPSPIVVVLSGSMEPAFQRGDILFMWNRSKRLKVGDIVVYDIKDRAIPIVHRIMRAHSSDKKQLLLTKGDNNPVDDINLYPRGQIYLDRERDIIGSVYGYLPWLGYLSILFTENEYVKYAVLGAIILSAYLQEE